MEQTKSVILPDLIKGLPDGYVLRAWIAACSTGEAYSLAIVKEVLESTGKHRNLTLQILLRI
jgi:two-component system CheB/CheR fusion protein